jgi:hypothetical protein
MKQGKQKNELDVGLDNVVLLVHRSHNMSEAV